MPVRWMAAGCWCASAARLLCQIRSARRGAFDAPWRNSTAEIITCTRARASGEMEAFYECSIGDRFITTAASGTAAFTLYIGKRTGTASVTQLRRRGGQTGENGAMTPVWTLPLQQYQLSTVQQQDEFALGRS